MEIDEYPKHSAEEWKRLIVDQKQTSLTDFLQSKRAGLLGDFPDEREETLTEIVDVVKLFPNDFLTDEQVGLLLEFFLARIDSSALAGGAVIKGIHHLVLNSVNLPKNFEDSLVLYMFKEGNVQSWGHQERRLQYDILQWMLKYRLAYLQSTGLDFIVTFMKCVSGERDPRCLILMFNMFLQVTKHFDMKQFSEEMFETIACYFPVEFKPKPNDTISRTYLASSCASCLVASPSFAPFCYLLIDEKLNDEECSDEQIEDILELMVLACEKFPPGSVSFNLAELLGGIRMVALNPKNHGPISPTVEKALNAVIEASEHIPKKDGSKAKFVADSLLENLEPFVLQAEMGLTAKALKLLRVGFLKLNEEYAKKVLDQTVSWIVTLVQGGSVNVAANRTDIVKEGLSYLVDWVRLSTERSSVGMPTLQAYEAVFFESCSIAREYCPNESLIAIYECASVYLDAGIASPLLVDRLRTMIVSGLKSPEFENELPSFSKMITSFSKADFREIDTVLESVESCNSGKLMTLLCSVVHSMKSWSRVKPQIKTELDRKMDEKCFRTYEQMCHRCAEQQDLLWELVTTFDEVVTFREGGEESKKSDLVDKYLQSIALLLSEENHEKYMKILFERLKNGKYEESLGLVILQEANPSRLNDLLLLPLPEDQHRRLIFSGVNRGVMKFNDLTDDELSDLWKSFVMVKALLLSKTAAALPMFSKLLKHIASLETDPECDKMFEYLMNFEMEDCNPRLCRYETGSLLWRQRIFFMVVPKYKEVFEAAGERSERLIGLLQPLLEFAHSLGSIQVKAQFEMLLPLLIQSLERKTETSQISPTVLRAIPSFLSNSEPFEKKELVLIISRLCKVLKWEGSTMPTILDALESLSILARRQPARSMYPMITMVSTVTGYLLGHKKRIIRQKSAAAKNLWEMLTTK